MRIDGNAQAILLLTVSFGRADRADSRPLTGLEWNRLASSLRDHGIEPKTLLEENPEDLLPGWDDTSVNWTRLSSLLGRGMALGMALEKWERAGLWIIARSDEDYPERLRKRLKEKRPPVLFGCGSRDLLADGGLAIVGSRDADDTGLAFAEELGSVAAGAGYAVVSGGSRGVDQKAMLGALKRGGNVVGVLGDSLLRAASSADHRDFLLSGNLTLVSPFNPESRFDVSRAMGRNKCIYCLADGAVVVSSAFRKGGTWKGATECLKGNWVPVWVRDGANVGRGNTELLKKGARRLPADVGSIADLVVSQPEAQPQLLGALGVQDAVKTDSPPGPNEPPKPTSVGEVERRTPLSFGTESQVAENTPSSATGTDVGFYELFLERFRKMVVGGVPISVEDVAGSLPDVETYQIRKWLSRGETDNVIERVKVKRRVKYQLTRRGLL
ncbi:MAG: DNA-processing protein DprA [Chloroflexota bacterium]|nr:DNA-processing protein DprA [Chloroflexota bacterium]